MYHSWSSKQAFGFQTHHSYLSDNMTCTTITSFLWTMSDGQFKKQPYFNTLFTTLFKTELEEAAHTFHSQI